MNVSNELMITIFLGIIVWLIILTVLVLREKKKKTLLYTDIGKINRLKPAEIYQNLYSYHTENNDLNIKSYKGYYDIIYSPAGSSEFRVVDQTGKVISGSVEVPRHSEIPTRINFDTNDHTSRLILQYKTNNQITLRRIEISLE